MVREKTVVKIQVIQVLELDGVDSMDKVLAEQSVEFSSIKELLRMFVEVWQKAAQISFRFL